MTAIVAAICLLGVVGVAVASAATIYERESLEITPTPNEAQTRQFSGTFEGMNFEPANKGAGGAQRIFCGGGYVQGSFTSAKRGMAQYVFTNCEVEAESSLKCTSPGFASGTLATANMPIFLTRVGEELYGAVTNPEYGEGTRSNIVIPQFKCGNAPAGPITGSAMLAITPLNQKSKTFTLSFHGIPGAGGFYFNEQQKLILNKPAGALSWTNFLHNIERISIPLSVTVTMSESEFHHL